MELKKLDLSGNPLNEIPDERTIQMYKMNTLSLTTKGVGRLADQFANNASHLLSLKLKANDNIKLEVESLEQLGKLSNFKILHIGKILNIVY